jgi:hypothetical protein
MAEDSLGADQFSAFALFSELGLVSSVDPVDGLLEHPTHQLIGRLEDGRPDKHLQLSHGHSGGLGSLKTGHHLLDFLVLGEEDLRRRL